MRFFFLGVNVREGRKIVQDADDCSRKKSESKRGRGPSRRFPRRTNAVASGLEQIKRTDDVKVLDKSNSTRFIDIPMEIGPVVIRMKSSASYLVKKSRTTSSVLSVILRLKVYTTFPYGRNMSLNKLHLISIKCNLI